MLRCDWLLSELPTTPPSPPSEIPRSAFFGEIERQKECVKKKKVSRKTVTA